MIVSQKYRELLQPYSHDRFAIISRTFCASRNLRTIVVFLQCTLKEKIPIFLINTLLVHIPLLALTDRWNDRQRNELILVGLGNLRFLQVNVQRFKENLKRFKVTHAAWGQNLSVSVHFHHVVGIIINYCRGENSMNVEILDRNNSEH